MPNGTVYVGRPTRWGNPARIEIAYSSASLDSSRRYHIGWSVYAGEVGPLLGTYPTADEARAAAVQYFRDFIATPPADVPLAYRGEHQRLIRAITERLTELRGHDLCCWCPEKSPCHADVLLELANGEPS